MAALAYMDEAGSAHARPDAARRWLLAPRVQAKLLQLADNRRRGPRARCRLRAADIRRPCWPAWRRPWWRSRAISGWRSRRARTLPRAASTTSSVVVGELTAGWAAKAPYDAISSKAPCRRVPEMLFDQLKDGGCLVAIVSQDGLGKATIWRRLARSVDSWAAFDAATPALPGFERAAVFVL